MKTAYERWVTGDYHKLPGGFELKMFEAYQHAAWENQLRLTKSFPEFFDEPQEGNSTPDRTKYYFEMLTQIVGKHTEDLEDLLDLEIAATQWLEAVRQDIKSQEDHMKDIKLRDDYLEHIHQAIALSLKLGLSKDHKVLSPLERDIPF